MFELLPLLLGAALLGMGAGVALRLFVWTAK